jgi:hypothetical protein
MRLTWNSRLAVLVLAVACVLGVASFSFAQAAPAAPAQAAAPAKPAIAFQNDAGVIIFFVKPDKTADFEDLMTKLKDGLAKMEGPEAKQMGAGMKLFKSPVAAGAASANYVLIADPVVKNVEYWLLSLLYKAYPNDTQALFAKWQDVKATTPASPSVLDLTLVMKLQ